MNSTTALTVIACMKNLKVRPRIPLCSILLACAIGAAPAFAQDAKEAKEAKEAKGSVDYNGGYVLKSADGNFKTTIGSRVQMRLEAEQSGDDAMEHAFYVPRARLSLSGHAWTPDLKYKLQIEWDKGVAALKDYYVKHVVNDGLMVQGGQFKRPFSRNYIASSSKLGVERTLTYKHFDIGRDLGVMVHNGVGKVTGFEYAVGVFNGTGVQPDYSGDVEEGALVDFGGNNVPDQMHPMIVFRTGLSNAGKQMYDSVDFKGGGLRWGVAVNTMVDLDVPDADAGSTVSGVDGMIKVSGLTLQAAAFMSTAQQNPEWSSQETADIGLHAETTYLIGEKFAPGLRFAQAGAADGSTVDMEFGLTGGIFLFGGHKVKFENDITQLSETDEDGTDTGVRVRTQMQFTF